MPTKLSRYAEGVMEVARIASIIMTPLFFNKYSSRIFEPDKATLLRSLSLLILLSWVIKIIESLNSKRKQDPAIFNLKGIISTPLVLPVIILTIVNIIAAIFSVAPRISFWGSYQRLQGLYTTLAYIVLFSSIIGNLRRREQVERLITTAILTSLPISLYGILQHYGIDPIPWGGDVTRRVASHMGNPIFVAAFLILVFPLTVGRIVDSFKRILNDTENLSSQTARATVYIFIVALQLIAIFFTQSRGPWLGLFSGGFFLFVLLSLHWQKRWLTTAIIIIAALAAGFLILLNIPEGPLQDLHTIPSFRRLGQLLDPESRTAKVRSLIWQGSFEMVSPHDPIEYPDGKEDPFNFLRPIIGYGPETMHMAYNPFYPPELAYVEKRNASPDRSHNETWDSLVFSGILGLIAYLGVFTSIFYYGLKWLGLINSARQRLTFFILYFGSGFGSAIVFSIWQGFSFAGLGLPFGLILGLILYLAVIAVVTKPTATGKEFNPTRSLTIIVLLSAVVAHFAEINFGISIVSTHTYFYVYAALILAVGYFLPKHDEYLILQTETATSAQKESTSRKKRGKKYQTARIDTSSWMRNLVVGGGICSLLLLPMNYEYISNLWGLTSASKILWTSFTQVKENVISYGVLALILTTWVSASVILSSEVDKEFQGKNWWKTFMAILGISALVGIFYGFWLSGSLAGIARLAPDSLDEVIIQVAGLEGLLTQFYAFLLLGILILGFFINGKWSGSSRKTSLATRIIAVVGFIGLIWLTVTTNLHIIHADIAFKMAEPFANGKQWPVANTIYRRAIEFSPAEDYYYLFLGRGSLEEAKTIEDPIQQEEAFKKAESDLLSAQDINPLNPDHTANLARLYSWWALQAPDNPSRIERGTTSDQYYERVTILSPNNARLWDEWAILHLNILENSERALELLNHSLSIDPKYDWTYALLGDYYGKSSQDADNDAERVASIEKAVQNYQQAIVHSPTSVNYYFALAGAYQSLDDIPMVIATLEDSLEYAGVNDSWKIEDNLTHYYLQLNDMPNALLHAQKALMGAPETEQERIRSIINQITASP